MLNPHGRSCSFIKHHFFQWLRSPARTLSAVEIQEFPGLQVRSLRPWPSGCPAVQKGLPTRKKSCWGSQICRERMGKGLRNHDRTWKLFQIWSIKLFVLSPHGFVWPLRLKFRSWINVHDSTWRSMEPFTRLDYSLRVLLANMPISCWNYIHLGCPGEWRFDSWHFYAPKKQFWYSKDPKD